MSSRGFVCSGLRGANKICRLHISCRRTNYAGTGPPGSLLLDLPTFRLRGFKCVAGLEKLKKRGNLLRDGDSMSYSLHLPMCKLCKKQYNHLDTLREHLLGSRSKTECSEQFLERGCRFCFKYFENSDSLMLHQSLCQMAPISSNVLVHADYSLNMEPNAEELKTQCSAISLDCEMVGGGKDGSFDLCARICVIDEHENILLNTYVNPQVSVIDYRFNITGIRPEDLRDATPVDSVRQRLRSILQNREQSMGKRKLLIGHSVMHDLSCLHFTYPKALIRDTAHYPPLMTTNNRSHSLRYLTATYLGYEIQKGKHHDPHEDAVAAMHLYKKMRMESHMPKLDQDSSFVKTGLKKMIKGYRCWCLDSR